MHIMLTIVNFVLCTASAYKSYFEKVGTSLAGWGRINFIAEHFQLDGNFTS